MKKSRLLYILKRRYLTVCPRRVSRIIFMSSLKFKTKRLESLNKIEYGYPCLSDMRWTFKLVRITLFRNCFINKYIKYSMSVIKTLTSERIIYVSYAFRLIILCDFATVPTVWYFCFWSYCQVNLKSKYWKTK